MDAPECHGRTMIRVKDVEDLNSWTCTYHDGSPCDNKAKWACSAWRVYGCTIGRCKKHRNYDEELGL